MQSKKLRNNIVATTKNDEEGWDKPWLGKRAFDFALKGRSYENIVAEKDLNIVDIKDSTFMLFSGTKIFFDDGSNVRIGCPLNECAGIETIKNALKRRELGVTPHFEEGSPIFQG